MELSGRIDLFQYIVDCGYEFARIYDYDDREMIPIREKFEETEELTWRKTEYNLYTLIIDYNIYVMKFLIFYGLKEMR